MKRIGNLITPESLTVEDCRRAIIEAAQKKKHKRSVRSVFKNLNYYSNDIRNQILNDTFVCSKFDVKEIFDSSSGKTRILHKPKFYPDQVAGRIALKFCGDIIQKRIDNYAISGFKKKGTIYGHLALRTWMKKDKKGTRYCLKCDIRKCYESIKPDIVMADLKHIIKDKLLLSLLSKIVYSLDSLPLGNYTSVYFANLVLGRVDQIARHDKACKHFLRYMDDFVIFGSNKRALRKILIKIQTELRKIGLEIKSNYQIFPSRIRGVDILGYRYFGTYTLLRKRNALKIMKQSRRIIKKEKAKKMIPFQQAAGFLSRTGQTKNFNSFKFKQKYVAPINIKNLKGVVSNASRRKRQRQRKNLSTVRSKISCRNEKGFYRGNSGNRNGPASNDNSQRSENRA